MPLFSSLDPLQSRCAPITSLSPDATASVAAVTAAGSLRQPLAFVAPYSPCGVDGRSLLIHPI